MVESLQKAITFASENWSVLLPVLVALTVYWDGRKKVLEIVRKYKIDKVSQTVYANLQRITRKTSTKVDDIVLEGLRLAAELLVATGEQQALTPEEETLLRAKFNELHEADIQAGRKVSSDGDHPKGATPVPSP